MLTENKTKKLQVTKHIEITLKSKADVTNQSQPLGNAKKAFTNHDSIQKIKLADFQCNRVFRFAELRKRLGSKFYLYHLRE